MNECPHPDTDSMIWVTRQQKTLTCLDVCVFTGADLLLWEEDRIPRGEVIYRTEPHCLSEVALLNTDRMDERRATLRPKVNLFEIQQRWHAAPKRLKWWRKDQWTEWRKELNLWPLWINRDYHNHITFPVLELRYECFSLSHILIHMEVCCKQSSLTSSFM